MTELGERPAPQSGSRGVYARKATGLVREVSPFSTFVFNMAGQPTSVLLATSVFWTLGVFVGGSIWLGFAMALVAAIVISVCYGLFTSAIPRSGGDYVLVGRVTHPIIGLISSFFWTTGVILSIAFIALAFVTVALGPSLTAVGLVSGHNTLVTAGNTLATSQWWQFGLGAGIIVGSSFLLAGGWRWTTRIMDGLWVLMMLGLGTVFFVLLFKTQSGFVNSFNEFARSITGEPDTYRSVVDNARKEGVVFNPAFSMDNTWPVWAAICSLSLYAWLSVYISGEVRRARDTTQMKVMGAASTVHIGIAVVLSILFFSRFGHDFFVAINALSINESESYPFAAPPYYTFLGSIAGGSTLLTWWLCIALAAAYPLLMIPNITIAVRTFFAWALDGLLPTRFAQVSTRTHAPNYAIALTVILSVAVLGWAVKNGETFYELLIEAVLMQFVTMILLGVAAVLLPYRRPEAWRASATTQRVLGIPIVALAGALAALLLSGLFFIWMHYPDLGLDKGHFLRDAAVVLAVALLTFFVARAARLRQGVDVDKLASEIPPE
ncbi:MAG TPA: APC family permease [Solirubrobacterales bacterium]|nr:APC family permease [Solirubrobacterales bacterium]